MIHVPVLRWGEPYSSLDKDKVVHFDSGEPIAEVSQANAGIIRRDMRKAQRARDVLREIPCAELVKIVQKAVRVVHEVGPAAGRRHADSG